MVKLKVPSKSTVPDPSVSISAIIPSKSSEVNLSSNAAKISRKVAVVMYPFPIQNKFHFELVSSLACPLIILDWCLISCNS